MAGFDQGFVRLRAAAFAAAMTALALMPQQSVAQDSEEETAEAAIEEIVVVGHSGLRDGSKVLASTTLPESFAG